MNGWEIDKPNEDILFGNKKRIKEYALKNPLAATDTEGDILFIIRKYHLSLNCSPDHPDYSSDTYRICLAYYDATSYSFFDLPTSLDYVGVEAKIDDNTGKAVLTIIADGISRTTNITELYQKFGNSTAPLDEEGKLQTFKSLENTIQTVQRAKIDVTEVFSEIIGVLQQDQHFDDWWHSRSISVPYIDGQELVFTFIDFNPGEDEAFISEADEVTRSFLSLNAADRESASTHIYKNCMEFLDAIGYNDQDAALWEIKNQEEIWHHVRYNQCFISREPYEDHQVYLILSCECDWETEHGLQLVFNKQGKLIRVSAEDGDILGYQGDGMIL
ncbi:DUF6985 domain-containing protein [Sphingobacterium chungjuense]|uniref:DUF6985 domain-containing protein n=1 Tax=Sphingobacterium chungjuense TaxID=2675553 RepID=UPI00140DEFA3|nr:hypothetical protein [Sphingobacterium chungjuense]